MLSAGQDFLRHKRGIRNTYLLGEVNALKYPHEELYKREVRFIRELIRLRIGEPGRRARQTLAEEWQICTFSTPSSAVIAFAWESKVTQEKFLITANAGLSEAEISLPDSWRTHSSLLVGYRSNGDCPRWVGPLSFSWFTFK